MSEVLARLGPALSDRYRIEREIGAGGMATVYLARDIKHDRDVALKVLRPELAAVLGAERFLNEIRISAKLDHPHILTLIDSGEADGFLYYVMPFVRGESLRSKLDREKQLGVDEALAITRQVGSALEYAHRQGVVHRDIKPENILLHEGEATLADFGIAMAVKEAGGNRLTETGLSLGTPQYMSPEQATGDRTLDARSDVYSLAAVLYEMLAGEPPHSGATVQAIIAKLMTERPTRLRVMRDTVPEGIDNAVAKALAKVPADRYANAGEFSRALTASSSGHERPRGRGVPWIPLAVGAAAVAIAGAAFVTFRGKPAPGLLTPDRVQITTTGNAGVPALSPDGTRYAFAEKECNAEGNCTYQLVIQDLDGTGRLVVTKGIAGVWDNQWTQDGRHLVYSGSYGATRWGAFAVSTLGGAPRRLGCCGGSALAGDTVLISPQVSPGDSIVTFRLVTVGDGQAKDSFRVKDPGVAAYAGRTDDPGLFLVTVIAPNLEPAELRLVDRRGTVLNRTSDGLDMRGREWTGAWLRGRSSLLLGVPRERGGRVWDFSRIRVQDRRFVPGADTVMRGVEMIDLGIDVAPDASRMVFASGPFEANVLAIEVSGQRLGTPKSVMTSTTQMWGRLSPDGRRIAIARQIVTGGRTRDQIWLTSFEGGDQSQLTGPLENLVDFEWDPDGSGIVYVNAKSGTERSVVEVDTTGSRSRVLLESNPSIAGGVQVLADDRFILGNSDGTRITLMSRDAKQEARWTVPQWFSRADRFSGSPDGKSIAVMGWDRQGDSTVVARIDVATGSFTRLASFGGEGYGRVKWATDGDIIFDIRESDGARGLFRMRPDGSAQRRVASLPKRFNANYTISADGKRIAVFTESDKSDVYMIRNLGEILAR